MGIYSEKSIPRWAGVVILIAAFIAIYQPWLLGDRELFRLEGLYAVSATEFDPSMPMVTAHGVAIQNVFPFFPAMASVFQKVLGMPMEFSLRFLSVLMMAATAVIVYFAAASERSYRAGLVAAAMYIGTFLALEKGIEGYPTTTNAFFYCRRSCCSFSSASGRPTGMRRGSSVRRCWRWVFSPAAS